MTAAVLFTLLSWAGAAHGQMIVANNISGNIQAGGSPQACTVYASVLTNFIPDNTVLNGYVIIQNTDDDTSTSAPCTVTVMGGSGTIDVSMFSPAGSTGQHWQINILLSWPGQNPPVTGGGSQTGTY